ncbi:MAG: hypothetical protein ABEJ72_08250 [Candidatus Aenigmatarchaeota archaeon]
MANQEKIGYHKGALESLLNEKSELSRILNIVNSLIEKHANALEKEGVDVEKFIENLKERQKDKVESAKKRMKESGRDEREEFDLSKEELPE